MSAESKTRGRASGRAGVAAVAGTTLEWFDFSLYAAAASTVFGPQFFAGSSPFIGTVQSLATFAVGFLVRPIGGAWFGSLGDRLGRKTVLIVTLLLAGTSTTLIGMLPNYSKIGVAAPLLLLLLRITQGLGVGAEYGGSALLAIEFGDRDRHGLLGSLPGSGCWIGTVLATGSLTLAAQLPPEQFQSWGWRLPFLASVVLVGLGLWLRRGLDETPTFRRINDAGTVTRRPLRDVLRKHPRSVLCVIATGFGLSGVGYFYQVFTLTYASTTLKLGNSAVFLGLMLGTAVAGVTTPVFGLASDFVGRRPVMLFGFGFSAAFTFPFFWILEAGYGGVGFWIGLCGAIGIGIAAIFGAQGAFFAELFPANQRFSGFGFSREVSAAIGGAISPLAAVQLAHWGGDTTWPLSLFVIVMCAISGIGVLLASETRKRHAPFDNLQDDASMDLSRG